MGNPLVSIVLCCHNRRDYLEQTLASVFKQNYEPVEIIVMDDGSTDGTREMLARYADRLTYYYQESQGIAAARGRASELANGELIAYQDDDDLMPENRIVHLYQALTAFPEAIFATGDFALIDSEGKLTGHRWMPGNLDDVGEPRLIADGQEAVLWPKVPAVPHTTLFRRDYGEAVGWFDLDFKYACSDADFLARLGQLGPIVYLPEVVSYYRRGHAAIWHDTIRTSVSQVQLWTKHLSLIGDSKPQLRQRLLQRLVPVLARLADHRARHPDQNDFDIDHYLALGVASLGIQERLRFQFQVSVKSPLKRLIRSNVA